ncbi:MAG: stage VI sporulation protein F [Bacillaceae bacterium]|nr:stage VI sporulation protein F [Bacillaceae bacterium]
MANKKQLQDMLSKLNKKSNKNWSIKDLKKLGAGISPQDLQDKNKAPDMIKKVAKAAGKNISDEKAKEIAKMVNQQLKK